MLSHLECQLAPWILDDSFLIHAWLIPVLILQEREAELAAKLNERLVPSGHADLFVTNALTYDLTNPRRSAKQSWRPS